MEWNSICDQADGEEIDIYKQNHVNVVEWDQHNDDDTLLSRLVSSYVTKVKMDKKQKV